MANIIPCGDCIFYHSLVRPQSGKRTAKDLHRGHCLNRTIYAVNKPGTHTYPAGAKTANLPYGRHKIIMVRTHTVVPHCTAVKPLPDKQKG